MGGRPLTYEHGLGDIPTTLHTFLWVLCYIAGFTLVMIFYVHYSISVFRVLESSFLNSSYGYHVIIWIVTGAIQPTGAIYCVCMQSNVG